MKKNIVFFILTAAAVGVVALKPRRVMAQTPVFQVEECVTIHWDLRDNTHVIRPNGNMEFLGRIVGTSSPPNRTDERAFYLNVAMNALAKEGYEFAGRTDNDVVMKRTLAK